MTRMTFQPPSTKNHAGQTQAERRARQTDRKNNVRRTRRDMRATLRQIVASGKYSANQGEG